MKLETDPSGIYPNTIGTRNYILGQRLGDYMVGLYRAWEARISLPFSILASRLFG
jgi:hypothetical protein